MFRASWLFTAVILCCYCRINAEFSVSAKRGNEDRHYQFNNQHKTYKTSADIGISAQGANAGGFYKINGEKTLFRDSITRFDVDGFFERDWHEGQLGQNDFGAGASLVRVLYKGDRGDHVDARLSLHDTWQGSPQFYVGFKYTF